MSEAALRAASGYALEFLSSLPQRAVNATADATTLQARFDERLPHEGMPPEAVIESLVRSVEGGLLGMPSGRFFAWVIGGALPAALGADWLSAAWGQNAALYATSPAAAIVESVVGKWLKAIFRLPERASFALVTGCQMAHTTCLAAARHQLLCAANWDVERDGLYGAPRIRIISSQRQHASVERAVRMLGLGSSCLTLLPSDEGETLRADCLEAALREDPTSLTIVVLQAGDINTGSFDNFEALVPLAKQHRAWVHVDGAFGLWASASPRYSHLLGGVAEADSWSADGHKWLNVPFDCGYAFVRDADAHRAAISVSAPYIAANSELRDEIDWNPEWSRRARGFATYAALKELGQSGLSSLIERTCRHASDLVERLGSLPGVEVLWRPIINQGLVRFLDPRNGAADADHDLRTEAVIQAIVESGEAFFAATTWRGKRCMRISVLNWRTTSQDVTRSADAVARVLEQMPAL